MSHLSKVLKISCFVTLFVGLVCVVWGIAVAAGGSSHAYAPMASGCLGTIFGLWAARAANVPSRAGSIATAAIALAAVGLVLAAAGPLIDGQLDVRTLVPSCAVTLAVAGIAFSARRVRREAELK